jgi:hypothetical protein
MAFNSLGCFVTGHDFSRAEEGLFFARAGFSLAAQNGRINENPRSSLTLQNVPRGTFAKYHKVTCQAIDNKEAFALRC